MCFSPLESRGINRFAGGGNKTAEQEKAPSRFGLSSVFHKDAIRHLRDGLMFTLFCHKNGKF